MLGKEDALTKSTNPLVRVDKALFMHHAELLTPCVSHPDLALPSFYGTQSFPCHLLMVSKAVERLSRWQQKKGISRKSRVNAAESYEL